MAGGMSAPVTKVMLDADTDQALAIARDALGDPDAADMLPAVDYLAGLIAEQFPAHRALAGCVVAVVAQFTCAAITDEPDIDPPSLGAVLALAAAKVVREAAAS
jgi:hypothetical protein